MQVIRVSGQIVHYGTNPYLYKDILEKLQKSSWKDSVTTTLLEIVVK